MSTLFQLSGQLREVGDGVALFVQPGTQRVLRVSGLTIKECQMLGAKLYDDFTVKIREVQDTSTQPTEKP